MATKTEIFNKAQLKKEFPNIRPGDTVRIFQKIQEKEKGKKKRKVQSFEGIVIAKKHGKGISATITVRKIISGIGVEKIFPIHSPMLQKIEILKRAKVRRAKLYYLRTAKGKKARLKAKILKDPIVWKEPSKSPSDNQADGEKSADASPETKSETNPKEKTEPKQETVDKTAK
jgi:large subunit ribosomal protein L19